MAAVMHFHNDVCCRPKWHCRVYAEVNSSYCSGATHICEAWIKYGCADGNGVSVNHGTGVKLNIHHSIPSSIGGDL